MSDRSTGVPLTLARLPVGRILAVPLLAGVLVAPMSAVAQATGPRPAAVIDTVILDRHDIYPPEEARRNFFYGTVNALHAVTRPYVIQRELLLAAGQAYDSTLAAETERNLRRRRLFREVSVDTTRTADGRLALRVRTVDAWSTRPRFRLAVQSTGRTTGTIGVTEFNLLGTGIPFTLAYQKFIDRDGIEVGTSISRAFGTPLFVGGLYQGLSDQKRGNWRVGKPFYSLSDRTAFEYSGLAFDGLVRRYRTNNAVSRDTLFWDRQAMIHRAVAAYAPRAAPNSYLRIGVTAEYRQETYARTDDTVSVVPDSSYFQIGGFAEYRRADFEVVQFVNGFAREDQDLSEVVHVGFKLAPAAWGYEKNGIGPVVQLRAGGRLGSAILKGVLSANAVYNSAGLDSGRVSLQLSGVVKPARKHALLVSLHGGVRQDPAPGGEYDLGFPGPPRLWDAHSFTGTRSVRVILEHRWFVWDDIFQLLGLGLAGFVDYAGAWYPDQDARFGGNVGIALLAGSPLNAIPENIQFSLGYRFGREIVGDRWVFSLGMSYFL